ncbi:2-keto-4-pentenoate hydratase [Planococcus shenhongbingii]|uniref:2-keto-4-pentenoate hydratase n=1 Tax=Planococcus shenhongbingii TaxID=3058398 RepID=UPI0026036103|nr:2-keto-4-pentenoate hydratase [Planococcus sp. N016]WKA56960.1 2-keto-4-pentenoate hydratase [Planococcus sp. N016]
MDIQKAANRLAQAEKDKTPIPPFTSSAEEISVEDAYQIQLLQIQEKLQQGAEIKGLKIGLTSKVMQDMFNVRTPDYGHVLDSMVYGEEKAVNMDQFIQPKVEFEIAFILKEDLEGPGVTVEDVLAATDYVVPAIEIIDSRIENWQFKFEDTVADNGSSAGAILGSKRTSPTAVDLATVEMTVYRNGEVFDSAKGEAVMGHPAKAVAWLANAVAEYGITLRAGYFILAGALSKAVPFEADDVFKADFSELGEVAISFVREGEKV